MPHPSSTKNESPGPLDDNGGPEPPDSGVFGVPGVAPEFRVVVRLYLLPKGSYAKVGYPSHFDSNLGHQGSALASGPFAPVWT